MEKRESVKFFTRFLLISVISIVNIVFCLSIATNGKFFTFLAIFLAILNVFVLVYLAVKSIVMLIKHLADKKKKKFEFLYIVNMLFSLVVTGLYMFFYFILIVAGFVILMPFLA